VSLKSRESAAINPQVEGWIVKIKVRSGEHVREGQPIWKSIRESNKLR